MKITGKNTSYEIAAFSSRFEKSVLLQSDGISNALYSPLSAYIALSMIKEGALGKTFSQLADVLGEGGAESAGRLISHLKSLKKTELCIADSVWIDNNFHPQKSFFKVLSDKYSAQGFEVKMSGSEDIINQWIKEHTNGIIESMLDEKSLDTTVMAVINTLCMKASWMREFSPCATHERSFYNADASVAAVDFMYKKAVHKVIETECSIGVSLPYSDGYLEFVALMPKDEHKPAGDAALDAIDNGGWGNVVRSAFEEKIELYFPKFEQKTSASLVDALKNLGITDAFLSGKACFSKISEGIFLEDIIQSTVLKVDEDGTEAAATTLVEAAPTSLLPTENEPRIIDFCRPFAFAVADTKSGAVLFSGVHNTSAQTIDKPFLA